MVSVKEPGGQSTSGQLVLGGFRGCAISNCRLVTIKTINVYELAYDSFEN